MYDIIVIGAGPAGLTAAIMAAETGHKVLVLERNTEAAKKIYATGNGKCNFLNRKAVGAEQILAFCNSIGICEAEEDDGRLYPRSRQASSVAKALISAAERTGAKLMTNCIVKTVRRNSGSTASENGKCNALKKENEANSFVVETENGESFASKKLIIACGGKAGIQLGCYGDGYVWANHFGHSIVKPIPALTGLECAEDLETLHGVRVNAKASLWADGKVLAAECGEVQFTKTAISGICVMNLSRHFRIGNAKDYSLVLDLFPEYSTGELEKLLEHQKQIAGCGLEGLVPEKMRGYLHERLHESMKEEIRQANALKTDNSGKAAKTHFAVASKLAKGLSFKVTGSRGWKDAQVTSGGIPLGELSDDYQSKLVPGLFFAGEIIDYDGPCGGYNLAWAFRSGMAAGSAAAE